MRNTTRLQFTGLNLGKTVAQYIQGIASFRKIIQQFDRSRNQCFLLGQYIEVAIVQGHDKLLILGHFTTCMPKRTRKPLDYQIIFRYPIVMIQLPQFVIRRHIQRLESVIIGNLFFQCKLIVNLPQRQHGICPEIPYCIVQIDK